MFKDLCYKHNITILSIVAQFVLLMCLLTICKHQISYYMVQSAVEL